MWPRRQGNDPVAKPDLLFARKERPVARRHRGTAKSRGGPDGYTGQRSVLRHRAGRRRRERDAGNGCLLRQEVWWQAPASGELRRPSLHRRIVLKLSPKGHVSTRTAGKRDQQRGALPGAGIGDVILRGRLRASSR